jgi:D-serine deaminase-like pyridoxal phosphate-dependent protein
VVKPCDRGAKFNSLLFYATHLRAIIEAAMAAINFLLDEFPWDSRYAVSGLDDILTPALVIYPEALASNIDATVRLLDGNPARWRAHIKTAKLAYTVKELIARGIRNFKCATTLELLLACRSGASDVLLAYPTMGANARRVREISEEFPAGKISILAENENQIQQWRGSRLGIFLDINSGMNRTGIEESHESEILNLARAVASADLEFRGLHYYDGHHGALPEPDRSAAAHRGYDHLMNIVSTLKHAGVAVPELITAGTPTFPCSLSYAGFRDAQFIHRLSPGTVVYNDATSLAQLPAEYGYRPAVLVLSRVVSHPRTGIITCDAGHKAVSADAGVPTCVVVGYPKLTPRGPSEEHLPIATDASTPAEANEIPKVGDVLYLLPRHVCPTVNNFDQALLVRNAAIESVETVSARGHETPLHRPISQSRTA